MNAYREERDRFRALGGSFEIDYPTVNIWYGGSLVKCVSIDFMTKYRISDCIETAIGIIEAMARK